MKKSQPHNRNLTDVELEFMNILWKLGEGTVNDVLEAVSRNRDLAYTSVSTIMRILEQKSILKSKKVGRNHIYAPLLSKAEYESHSVQRLVTHVFEGNPLSIVKHLLNSENLDQSEINHIREILNSKESKE